MKLPEPKDINAYVDALFSEEYREMLNSLAKSLTPVADVEAQS